MVLCEKGKFILIDGKNNAVKIFYQIIYLLHFYYRHSKLNISEVSTESVVL